MLGHDPKKHRIRRWRETTNGVYASVETSYDRKFRARDEATDFEGPGFIWSTKARSQNKNDYFHDLYAVSDLHARNITVSLNAFVNGAAIAALALPISAVTSPPNPFHGWTFKIRAS